MNLERKTYTIDFLGKPLTLEVSKIAQQANAAVLGTYGHTSVLATVVMGKENTSLDYFPLTVDYEERFYAAGKIIGSRFIRREGRPSDDAILSGRLIDRAIRPLFDSHFRREVQVTITVISYDEVHDPEFVGLLAASTALSISDIPWNGPVGGVYFASQPDESPACKAFFAGPLGKVNMIEFEGLEAQEQHLHELYDKAQAAIDSLITFQQGIVKEIGKEKASFASSESDNDRLRSVVSSFITPLLDDALQNKSLDTVLKNLLTHLKESGEDEAHIKLTQYIFEEEVERYVHTQIILHGKRPDGRALNQIRDLYSEVAIFPRIHGSGLFIRGSTQVLAIATLAAPNAEQLVETMETTGTKRFLLHYNFPNFAVGETGRSRGPGRREIGHGALALKAIKPLIPTKEQFPYTIRVVAETLSSNGSSSMASTCAASLALMDAGVPIMKHIAGISIGLALNEATGQFKVLTDIQGPEDHYCDMDFKVAGTRDGVTAIQMDVKVQGITKEIYTEALARAREARFSILDFMETVISTHRSEISPYAPKVLTLTIPPEKIGLVVGSGGKTINGILSLTNNEVTIDIEQTGLIYFCGTNLELVQKALQLVEQIIREYKVGDIVLGTVTRILDFGAILDLGGGKDGLVHISELKNGYVKSVNEVLKMGDQVRVKVIRVDEDGRVGLSIKSLEEKAG